MSTAMRSAFQRIDSEYGSSSPSASPSSVPPGAPWGDAGAAGAFKASRAFDKLIVLATLGLVSGVLGWFTVPAAGAAGLWLIAFVLVLIGWFRMRWARYLAPTYSVCAGLALGSVSASFATLGHGVVPAAIVFTAGIFLAALGLYRTGIVRVTPRMMSMAIMGGFGVMAVGVLWLLGVPVPGVDELTGAGLVVSVLFLGVAILNLFTDFEYVNRSEAMAVSAEGEWAAAFAMMTALVLVYISMLRILGAAAGGGRQR